MFQTNLENLIRGVAIASMPAKIEISYAIVILCIIDNILNWRIDKKLQL